MIKHGHLNSDLLYNTVNQDIKLQEDILISQCQSVNVFPPIYAYHTKAEIRAIPKMPSKASIHGWSRSW